MDCVLNRSFAILKITSSKIGAEWKRVWCSIDSTTAGSSNGDDGRTRTLSHTTTSVKGSSLSIVLLDTRLGQESCYECSHYRCFYWRNLSTLLAPERKGSIKSNNEAF